ncbi:MAG: UDP-N-acetylglucosamine pyrophosphorylase [Clostridia bacterium]|nr:UDP-N-acetylglucosamine pyrophosphorylase [Clostridia bacterium]
MNSVETAALFDRTPTYLRALFLGARYPWEVLSGIGDCIQQLLESPPAGFRLWREGVLVGEGVSISEAATILPPAVIGSHTEIRPGAFLRGNVITGERCVIGNSSELKNCVLLDGVQVPHYNYVGDSVLGNGAHMGAGAICSNLKSDGRAVVIHGDREYATGRRKLGAILGDGADVGCGCVLNPGTVIGKHTSVYPLTSVRGVIPSSSIVKAMDHIVIKREKEQES